MLQLLGSLFKRVTTIVTTPFRMLLVRIQRLFNINIISAKLISPLRKIIKKLITLKPQSRSDYIAVGRWWVYKKLFLTAVLVICAGVFIYFNLFAPKLPAAMPTAAAVKTDTTFDYNDMALRSFTGVANIRDSSGAVVYTGDIAGGICTGSGTLWNREGKLLYEGEFVQNQYSGQGISYYLDGSKRYEGGWANNLYNGDGKLYADNGTKIYDGFWKDGLCDGAGKTYSNTGVLLYEGEYSAGVHHGFGTSYGAGGTMRYQGEFLKGLPQGQGKLYDSSGKLLYTGYMHQGKINYRALLSGSFQEVKDAFAENPQVFYTENQCAFAFEQAGVVVTVDCRVQVDVWEKNTEAEDKRDFYMPGDNWGRSAQGSYQEESVYTQTALREPSGWMPMRTGSGAMPFALQPAVSSAAPSIRPVDWYMVDESTEGREHSGSSGSDSSSSGSDSSSSSSDSSSPGSDSSSASSDSSSPGSGRTEELEIRSDGEQSGQQSGTTSRPGFIEKELTLYFEIDSNVWQSEATLDATKIPIRRVTAFTADLPSVGSEAVEFHDDAQPFIEDCVAIDFIRQRIPTAFPQVIFEADRQNKLFIPILNINYASRIERKTYLVDEITYRYAYNQPDDAAPLYVSIER